MFSEMLKLLLSYKSASALIYICIVAAFLLLFGLFMAAVWILDRIYKWRNRK